MCPSATVAGTACRILKRFPGAFTRGTLACWLNYKDASLSAAGGTTLLAKGAGKTTRALAQRARLRRILGWWFWPCAHFFPFLLSFFLSSDLGLDSDLSAPALTMRPI